MAERHQMDVMQTNFGMSLHSQNSDTFYYSSAGVIDAVEHRLNRRNTSVIETNSSKSQLTFNCIIVVT